MRVRLTRSPAARSPRIAPRPGRSGLTEAQVRDLLFPRTGRIDTATRRPPVTGPSRKQR